MSKRRQPALRRIAAYIEREVLDIAIRAAGGNHSQAARALNEYPSNLLRRLRAVEQKMTEERSEK